MIENVEQFEKLKKTTNALNLWSFIITWAEFIISIPITIIVFSQFDIAGYMSAIESSDMSAAMGFIGKLIFNPLSLFSFAFALARQVITIISAVFNNKRPIKKLYNENGISSVSAFSIVGIFFFQYIFATIVFFQAKNVLKENTTESKEIIKSVNVIKEEEVDITEDKKVVAYKKRRNNLFNLWVMIINLLTLLYVFSSESIFGILITIISVFAILAVLVLNIISAVFNNDREIKKIFNEKQKRLAAPVLSIVMAVSTYMMIFSYIFSLAAIIFSIIIYTTTRKPLTK